MSTRVQFGRPLSAKQAVRHLLARMRLQQEASSAGIQRVLEHRRIRPRARDGRCWPIPWRVRPSCWRNPSTCTAPMGFTWEVTAALRTARSARRSMPPSAGRAGQPGRPRLHPVSANQGMRTNQDLTQPAWPSSPAPAPASAAKPRCRGRPRRHRLRQRPQGRTGQPVVDEIARGGQAHAVCRLIASREGISEAIQRACARRRTLRHPGQQRRLGALPGHPRDHKRDGGAHAGRGLQVRHLEPAGGGGFDGLPSGGAIPNVASVAALRSAANSVVYSGIKAGHPGHFRARRPPSWARGPSASTPVSPVGRSDRRHAQRNRNAERDANRIARTPMGRLGTVEDIARSICFLASDDAAFITAQARRWMVAARQLRHGGDTAAAEVADHRPGGKPRARRDSSGT